MLHFWDVWIGCSSLSAHGPDQHQILGYRVHNIAYNVDHKLWSIACYQNRDVSADEFESDNRHEYFVNRTLSHLQNCN